MPVIHCKTINAQWDIAPAPLSVTNAVHVWRVPVTASLHLMPQCLSVLNTDERSRAASYHHEKDKDRFIISRGMLRVLLGRYTGTAPQDIKMIIGENKKPYLQTTSSPIHYNMAHSGDLVLIAIAGSPVGVDVEYMDTNFNYAEILPTCFSNEEAQHINAAATFYTLWTRKEALLKATGKGIDDDLVHVPCIDGIHNAAQSIIGSQLDWTINSFEAGKHYISAIAFQGAGAHIVFIQS